MEGMGEIDLLVVGAGLHGIAMAKTYLQVHPKGKLLVVDQASSIGGSWAKERLYPGLKTNNKIGSYEFGDFPMDPEHYGVKPGGHIPGEVVHAYLCDVAAHFGIDSRLRLATRVQSAKLREDGRWDVTMEFANASQPQVDTLVAGKMVIATGLTSEPRMPSLPGLEDFHGLVLHSKQLKGQSDNLASCKNVVVLGGNKSAWDVCYSAARSGSQVHMIIRPEGGGPSYLWPNGFSWGPFQLSLAKLSATRIFTQFDPTPHGKAGPLAFSRNFLHRTSLGQKLCQFFWTRLDARVKDLNAYSGHLESRNLEPWTTPFWMGNSLSIHNYDTNWFELVREGKIRVHIADPISLSKSGLQLSSGEVLHADALVCCTGWKTVPSVQLDLSCVMTGETLEPTGQVLAGLSAEATSEIRRDISYLDSLSRRTANAPRLCAPEKPQPSSLPSFRLYRLSIPSQSIFLERKNLAFMGMHSSVHAVVVAQAQALWVTAFFDGKINHLSPPYLDTRTVEYCSILEAVYGKLRRPRECGGAAGRYPDLVFDSIPYVDVLLKDLGLAPNRKSSLFKELFEVYLPKDYRGITEEWMRKNAIGTS